MGNDVDFSKRFVAHMPPWILAFMVWFFTSSDIRIAVARSEVDTSLLSALFLAVGLIIAATAVALAGSAVSAWIAGLYDAKIENGKHRYIWGIGGFVALVLVVWGALNIA